MKMRLVQSCRSRLVCSIVSWAQSNKGGISGTVFDPTGAVVPGATVIITDLGTQKATDAWQRLTQVPIQPPRWT